MAIDLQADIDGIIARVREEAAADARARFPGIEEGDVEWAARLADVVDGHARKAASALRNAGRADDAREVARALAAPAAEPVEGARVRYHGSIDALHGTWEIEGPCDCRRCDAGLFDGFPRRLRLVSADHQGPLSHVSWLSVSPLVKAGKTRQED